MLPKKKKLTHGDSDKNGAALGYGAQAYDLWKPILSLFIW